MLYISYKTAFGLLLRNHALPSGKHSDHHQRIRTKSAGGTDIKVLDPHLASMIKAKVFSESSMTSLAPNAPPFRLELASKLMSNFLASISFSFFALSLDRYRNSLSSFTTDQLIDHRPTSLRKYLTLGLQLTSWRQSHGY